jgi:hypothetical protein
MRVALVTVSLFALLGTNVPGQATDAPPATKQLLHRIADAFGMLRTTDEEDMIATLRFWGTGTLMVDGRPCRLASYAASVNYHVPGARIEYACAEAGGKPGPRHVEVVAGSFAWNEEAPGGAATPASASAADRLLDLWTLPHAAVKAAVLAGARTSVSTEGGATVLTFPVPSADATMKVTLNSKPIAVAAGSQDLKKVALPAGTVIERVETRRGSVVTETTYAEFGDFNGADYFSDVVFPRRITQKRGGVTTLDLTVEKTNTYNPYVVMPVPRNVRAASTTALNR